MRTIFCRGCGVQIHEDAATCPHCGAPQAPVAQAAVTDPGSPWLAWTALPLALLSALSVFEDESWNRDSFVGASIVGAIGIALAVTSLAQKRQAKPVAVFSLVVGILGFLSAFGSLN